ncbi:MAG: 16S rRNA (cytosine(967)-C(5))-methyltransferase RsmB [Alphaproteobacteria bacterium]
MSPAPERSAGPRWPADARGQALALLSAVFEDRMTLDAALAAEPGLARLAPRDRAFARLMTVTVLRRLNQLDRLIDTLMERPLPRRQMRVRTILRLGAAQMVFLDTPPHAAVNGAVDLARAVGVGGMRNLVNAVLRRIASGDRATQRQLASPGENTPDWLWQRWRAAYGEDTAAAIAASHLTEPPLDLTVNGPRIADPQAFAATLDAELLPTGSLRRKGGGAVTDIPGYAAGDWWVQDAAAALPARLLGDVAGKSVVDLCAAPGGKTAQLAAAGARVTAVDVAPARLALVEANLARLGLAADCVAADAAEWRPPAKADAVLLDAPCTATGTLRRHPDIAWLKSPRDIAVTVAMQDRLLDAAAEMLAPGGTLVYAVCSLLPEEGVERIAALLDRNAALERLPMAASELAGFDGLAPPAITSDGDLRTLPCHFAERGGMDGFYAARLSHR